uniref:Uncharacterized protein n=1 Tax=Anguilla anguilla TaxID=7936 RepID=A0A0E9VK28_ANGAN
MIKMHFVHYKTFKFAHFSPEPLEKCYNRSNTMEMT